MRLLCVWLVNPDTYEKISNHRSGFNILPNQAVRYTAFVVWQLGDYQCLQELLEEGEGEDFDRDYLYLMWPDELLARSWL
jgi:hypothetical protein